MAQAGQESVFGAWIRNVSERARVKTVLFMLLLTAATLWYTQTANSPRYIPQVIFAPRSEASPLSQNLVRYVTKSAQLQAETDQAKQDARQTAEPVDLSPIERALIKKPGSATGKLAAQPRMRTKPGKVSLKRSNPFRPPSSGYVTPSPTKNDAPGVLDGHTKKRLLRDKLNRERRQLELQRIVNGRMIVINGKLYHLGETIGSFQIIGIDSEAQAVTLEALELIYVLRKP